MEMPKTKLTRFLNSTENDRGRQEEQEAKEGIEELVIEIERRERCLSGAKTPSRGFNHDFDVVVNRMNGALEVDTGSPWSFNARR